jgi:hypothetical protein
MSVTSVSGKEGGMADWATRNAGQLSIVGRAMPAITLNAAYALLLQIDLLRRMGVDDVAVIELIATHLNSGWGSSSHSTKR